MSAPSIDNANRSSAASADLRQLLDRAGQMEQRVRTLVEARRAGDPSPDDPFRGLYLDDAALDRLLLGPVTSVEFASRPSGDAGRLSQLSRAFELTELDLDLLLVALLADLDPRLEQLFGYLNDDVTRRRPSAAVALALCGQSLSSAAARSRLLVGPLVRQRLLQLEDPDRPFPGRSLRLPDRVVSHLLGDDSLDPALHGVVAVPRTPDWGDSDRLATALAAGLRLAYLREAATGSALALAATAARGADVPVLAVDLRTLADSSEARWLWQLAVREAKLRRAVLCAGPIEALPKPAALLDAMPTADLCIVLWGTAPWDPAWADGPALLVDVRASTVAERDALWQKALGASELDLATATRQFRMRPEQVVRAASSAQVAASVGGHALDVATVRAAARAENSTALDALARRVDPGVGWDDLVLPSGALSGLREVALRARHRELVLGTWRMRPGGGRGHGIAALFAGDSGTGKTMSAEVVAADLGLDLYVVDLATVVDKYVGETEKNLERIFTAASGLNAVLLFDEADAIFGKRSEVRDAHDKYANVESAYLLQRMETFDGLAILATNLRSNIDEAFTRRLDVMVDFPLPDPAHRELLWDRSLGPTIPRAADLDLAYCAQSFELAGGAIRSAAVTAAYLAAEHGDGITIAHVVRAVQREYRKLGRLCLPGEFGAYWSLLES